MKATKKFITPALAVSLALFASGSALAAYPEKPITLIVPWGAGGGTDTTARIIAKALSSELDVPVNVVNRTGGQGVIGHSAIASAKPDGYTLGLITGEITMMHWAGLTELSYKDYTPLGKFTGVIGGVEVKKDSEFNNINELVKHIKNNPGELTASGGGYGSVWQLNLAGFLGSVGLPLDSVRWVPSEGSASALQELVAGGVDFTTTSINESDAMIRAGEVKGLAVMAKTRSEWFPDVPTAKEKLNSDWQSGSWNGLAGPANLPDDVIEKLLPIVEKIQRSKEIKNFVSQRRLTLFPVSGNAWKQELEKLDSAMGRTMKTAGLAK